MLAQDTPALPASGSSLDPDTVHIDPYHPVPEKPPITRRYTQDDANSLVGGESLGHAAAALLPEKPYNELQKVFLFSLPFGGLLSIRAGLKLPFSAKETPDPELESLRLRLERQQTLNTIDEAKVFSAQKGTDDVRFRAMRHSLKENISELLPDFISKKDKPYEAVYADLDGPVVVMGGYRGLVLRDAATKKRVWVPLKAGLNLGKIDLLLGPTREDELRAVQCIVPDGILKNIGPFDICRKFIKKLDNGRTTVKEFGYDWRVSLALSSERLIDCLEKLRRKTGRTSIVVAHSMGGLVAHAAMQKRPELFRGIVYVGTPSECLNILGPLRYGDSVMLSDKILTFETNFMMRSLYAFLPLSGRVFANKETGEWYDIDYFDPETWVEYNLNPLVLSYRRNHETDRELSLDTLVAETTEVPISATSSLSSRIMKIPAGINRKSKPTILTNLQMQKRHRTGRLTPGSPTLEDSWHDFKFLFLFNEAYNYLCDVLKQTKEFVLGLEFKEELKHKYPPLAMVYGNKVPSVRGSYVSSPQDIKDGSYYEFFYGAGDGVVHLRWLMPERKGFQMYDEKTGEGHIVGKFATAAGHVNLMTDLEVMADALHAIVEADKTWRREE